uniref:Uncharacterized protein n=1 Tax=Parascaris equorum TaxID=6256 RepID=A0A914RPD3_PAREQ
MLDSPEGIDPCDGTDDHVPLAGYAAAVKDVGICATGGSCGCVSPAAKPIPWLDGATTHPGLREPSGAERQLWKAAVVKTSSETKSFCCVCR